MRTPDSVRAAQSARDKAWNWASVRGLPPGYIEGFKMDSYRGKPRFTDGICSVMGMPVEVQETHVVSSGRYERTKVAERRHYCYLDRQGTFFVDLVKPVYRGTQHAKYHPSAEYRYLGFFFLDCDKNLIFWRGQDVTDVSDIIIARDDFEGYADYECSGDEDNYIDHEYFQDAIDYASAIGGGRILVRPGTYYFGAAAAYKSNVTIAGDNAGGVVIQKNGSYNVFSATGTALVNIENIGIESLTITRASGDGASSALVNFNHVTNGVVSECIFLGVSDAGCLTMDNCDGITCDRNSFQIYGEYGVRLKVCTGTVRHNDFTSSYVTGAGVTYAYGIYLLDTQDMTVSENVIRAFETDADSVVGIMAYGDSDGCAIRGNTITGIRGGIGIDAAYVYGIYVALNTEGITIEGNTIRNCYSLALKANFCAIETQYATTVNTQVKSNTCIDNGNLIDRGNCESATAPMLAGETAPPGTADCTWARSGAEQYEGSYSWRMKKTSAAGAGTAYHRFQDNTLTNDMHGLIAELTYKIFFYGKVPAAAAIGQYYITFQEYYAAGWHIIETFTMSETDAWELLTASVTITAATTGVSVTQVIHTDEAVNSLFYLDNIRLQPIGVHNEHSQQFSDAGTGTLTASNSWGVPH